MHSLLPPELFLMIPPEPGSFISALCLGALTAAFALRMEHRHK